MFEDMVKLEAILFVSDVDATTDLLNDLGVFYMWSDLKKIGHLYEDAEEKRIFKVKATRIELGIIVYLLEEMKIDVIVYA